MSARLSLYDQLPRPAIFAHRGASAHAPENTLAAFKLAVEEGADAIELDAMLCADGHVVVIHDDRVERTTDGQGRVRDLSLAQLKELNAGLHFANIFSGEKIPTLAEVLETVPRHILINIELKNSAPLGDDLAEKVSDLVVKQAMQERVMFSSFDPRLLRQAARRLPTVPIALLAAPGLLGAIPRSPVGRWLVEYRALHAESSDIHPHLVERLHRGNHRLHVYTVNHPFDMRCLFQLGVDGIFSDDPALARQVLEDFLLVESRT